MPLFPKGQVCIIGDNFLKIIGMETTKLLSYDFLVNEKYLPVLKFLKDKIQLVIEYGSPDRIFIRPIIKGRYIGMVDLTKKNWLRLLMRDLKKLAKNPGEYGLISNT